LFSSVNFTIVLDKKPFYYWNAGVVYKEGGKEKSGALIEATKIEVLNHELSHAFDRLNGTSTVSDYVAIFQKATSPTTKNVSERNAMKRTNPMERRRGVPERDTYTIPSHAKRKISIEEARNLYQDKKGVWRLRE
jgi:hypothetical protein